VFTADNNNGTMTLTTIQPSQPQSQPLPQVIGSTIQPSGQCPCCQQSLSSKSTRTKHKINGESPLPPPSRFILQTYSVKSATSSSSLFDQGDDSDDDDDLVGLQHADRHNSNNTMMGENENYHQQQEHLHASLAPGILRAGDTYTPTQILVEGWLHKKGTGRDWLGSRAWKARWGRLCMAKLANQDIEVPLLLMYWYPSSSRASTVILLDQTVVVAVDYAADPKAWNAHRFEIRHAYSNQDNHNDDDDDYDDAASNIQHVTRTFCAAQRQERDAWVYAMAQALLSHAKSQAIHKRAVNCSSHRIGIVRSITNNTTTKWMPKNIPMMSHRAVSPPPRRPLSPTPPSLPKSPRSVRPTITAQRSCAFWWI